MKNRISFAELAYYFCTSIFIFTIAVFTLFLPVLLIIFIYIYQYQLQDFFHYYWIYAILFFPTFMFAMQGLKLDFSLVLLLIIQFFSKEKEWHPKSFKRIKELAGDVCNQIGVTNFHEIIITKSVDAATSIRSNKKRLYLGIILAKYLTIDELKAIIAHECGHHIDKRMIINKIDNKLVSVLDHLEFMRHSLDISKYLGPNFISDFWLFNIFSFIRNIGLKIHIFLFDIFFWLIRAYSIFINFIINHKEYEFFCDKVAIQNYGGNIFSSALVKVHELNVNWYSLQSDKQLKRGLEPKEFIKMFNDNLHRIKENEQDTLEKQKSYYSYSHPSINSRIEAAMKYKNNKVETETYLFSDEELYEVLEELNTQKELSLLDIFT